MCVHLLQYYRPSTTVIYRSNTRQIRYLSIKPSPSQNLFEDVLCSLTHIFPRESIYQGTVRIVLYLEEKFEVEKIPEYIIEANKTIDNLEDERQEILRQKQQARKDRDIILQQLDEMRQQRDAIVAELEKYGKEIPSIPRIRELETKLDEANKQNEYYEKHIRAPTKELDIVSQGALRLGADGREIEADGRILRVYRYYAELKGTN